MPITLENDVIFGSGDGFFGRLGANPVSTVLSDGRIAVAWNEYQYPGDGSIPGLDYDTWTRVLNPDGTPATEATLVNDTRVGSHAQPMITALSDGGYAVAWVAMNHETVEGTEETVYTYDSYARSYTAAGVAEGPAVLVSPDLEAYDPADYNAILGSNIQDTNIVGLDGGGAVVLYDYRDVGALYGDGGTYARILGNDGQTLGAPVRVWDDNLFSQEIEQLETGDIAMIRFLGDLSGYEIRLSGADLTSAPSTAPGAGGPVFLTHDPQPDVNAGGYGSAMRLAALSDGGFAVLYGYNVQLGTPDDESLRLDRFDASGSFVSALDIPVPDDSVQLPGQIPYQILGLSGGRVLVTWSHVVAYRDTDIMGVVVNADGSLESEPAVINPNTAGYQLLGGPSLMADGGLFLPLADASAVQVNGVADYMHGLFFGLPDAPPEPNLTRDGTDGPERLVGGGGNDLLRGFGGNDTLEGGDGRDTLSGGDGNDTIYGGATEADRGDVIYGGNGHDMIDAGWGNDEVGAGAGNDTVLGGYGADTLIGNEGDDRLDGGVNADVLYGNDGNDFFNGGFANDRYVGGAGADTFFHTGTAQFATDWIQDYSAAEGDRLQFGGTASLNQFQVNFAQTPAGDDTVDEAFVVYRPTGQILWALVDGAGQDHINIVIGGVEYDLLA